ncbi:MAG: sensor diguanylate cyclase [Herminiimonas sp.]|nr:sensor diguanylate cyclase [Herminiimonas sp.]
MPRNRRFELAAVVGFLLIGLGGTTMLGWTLHIKAMTELKRGLVPMVFNAGLCFFLSGLALAVSSFSTAHTNTVRRSIGTILIALCGLTLLEFVFNTGPGIDLPFLHTWYDYKNVSPGRMAPNTAIGFIFNGVALILASRVSKRIQAYALVAVTCAVFGIGLTGLIGYLLAPDLLFGWARSARMAIHTATGIILCAVGLWLAWTGSDWYANKIYFGDLIKIRFLSAAIMLVVGTAIGLTGFALVQGGLEKTIEKQLDGLLGNRALWFETAVEAGVRHVLTTLRVSRLDALSTQTVKGNRDALLQSQLMDAGRSLVGDDYRGVALRDERGTVLYGWGSYSSQPKLIAALNADNTAMLVWDDETLLRVRQPITDGNRKLGDIEVDIRMPALGNPFFDVARFGHSTELAMCIGLPGTVHCFPNAKNQVPFSVVRTGPANPLPMELALIGNKGIAYAVDYRQRNVIAAYTSVAPGLGFIAKEDTAEAYAPIRHALAIGGPVILIVAIAGALFLYLQLNPLVTRMQRSEIRAAEAATRVQTIMHAVGDGIITIDRQGTIESVNTAGCKIFGYEEGDLVGKSATVLMPLGQRDGHTQGIARLQGGGPPHMLGIPNVSVTGLRRDGAEFPMELTVNAVRLSRHDLYVGVMRDITVRRELEEKLTRMAQFDELTGLPNRALFMDRLNTAMLRAKRSNTALALMFVDLDGFKKVNDLYGHHSGDALLVQAAARLSASVRKSDTVARLAGDEFTVILEDLQLPGKDAKEIAQKIVMAMQAPFSVTGQDVTVTVSIGLVVHDNPGRDIPVAELLKRADTEMYTAKRAGKNAFSMA